MQQRSIAELTAAIRNGVLSARKAVFHHLDRSKSLQGRLNAYTHIDERAMTRA